MATVNPYANAAAVYNNIGQNSNALDFSGFLGGVLNYYAFQADRETRAQDNIDRELKRSYSKALFDTQQLQLEQAEQKLEGLKRAELTRQVNDEILRDVSRRAQNEQRQDVYQLYSEEVRRRTARGDPVGSLLLPSIDSAFQASMQSEDRATAVMNNLLDVTERNADDPERLAVMRAEMRRLGYSDEQIADYQSSLPPPAAPIQPAPSAGVQLPSAQEQIQTRGFGNENQTPIPNADNLGLGAPPALPTTLEGAFNNTNQGTNRLDFAAQNADRMIDISPGSTLPRTPTAVQPLLPVQGNTRSVADNFAVAQQQSLVTELRNILSGIGRAPDLGLV